MVPYSREERLSFCTRRSRKKGARPRTEQAPGGGAGGIPRIVRRKRRRKEGLALSRGSLSFRRGQPAYFGNRGNLHPWRRHDIGTTKRHEPASVRTVAYLRAVRGIWSRNGNVPTGRERCQFDIRAAPGISAIKLDVGDIEDTKDKPVVGGVSLVLRLRPPLSIKIPVNMYRVRVPREQDNAIIIVGRGETRPVLIRRQAVVDREKTCCPSLLAQVVQLVKRRARGCIVLLEIQQSRAAEE